MDSRVPDLKRQLSSGNNVSISASDFTKSDILDIGSATTRPSAGTLTITNPELLKDGETVIPASGTPPIGCPPKIKFATGLDVTDDDTWYFAYGSNLSKGRKEERTGLIRSTHPAFLTGYRLAFNKRGDGGEVYANIVPQPNGKVWGVIYLCNPKAMAELDLREGVTGGHYHRERVKVEMRDGRTAEAETYIAGSRFVVDEAVPGDFYLNLILEGARVHSLPEDYIEQVKLIAGRTPKE